MSSDAIFVRFPTGMSEYRLSDKKPRVGDKLKRNGDNWIVEKVTEDEHGATIVTLRPGLKPA